MRSRYWMFSVAIASSVMAVDVLRGESIPASSDSSESRLAIARGSLNLALNVQAMKDLGISIEGASNEAADMNMMLQIDAAASSFQLSRRDGRNEGLYGMLSTSGGQTWNISAQGRTQKTNVGDLLLGFGGRYASISDTRDLHLEMLQIVPETVKVVYEPEFSHLLITGEVKVAEQFMLNVFGTDRGIGNTVGLITIEGVAEPAHSESDIEYGDVRAAGPDVTVGELRGNQDNSSSQPVTWGAAGGYVGYSFGTTSCNVGTQPLDWYDFGTATPDKHPVINQGLYRYTPSSAGGYSKFEMVGQAWLKHGFCALQGTVCLACTPFCGGCCDELGVGCSDPYNANRNGSPGGMGPKSQINAALGKIMVWPYSSGVSDDVTTCRLRALTSDVSPISNPGALFYCEGQYVAEDDATAGNKNNNASYRRCTIGASPNFTMAWASTAGGQTLRQTQAIKAWQVNDPVVAYVDVDVPNDGRFTLGYRVTDLSGIGNGPWHYEYAVHNMNSDRSASSFSVPCTSTVTVSNTGFRDVEYYRDGYGNAGNFNYTPYDGTDWPATIGGSAVSWDMVIASPPENSNALRWGTQYNFRFDANSPPIAGEITMNLFKGGSPTSITFSSLIPTPIVVPSCFCPGDLNNSLTVDGDDIPPFASMYMGQTAVDQCADVGDPLGGPLDDTDVAKFVEMLVNGSNVCK